MTKHHLIDRTGQGPTVTMICTLLLLCSMAFPTRSHAEEAFHLSLGYTGSAYLETTNKDIQAAVSVLIKKIAWKYFGKSEAQYYDNISEMAAAMKSGKVQVLCGPPEEYMKLRAYTPVDPILITASSSGYETELLLLVRKDSGIRSLSDLKNKSLVMPARNTSVENMFQVWIETLLMRAGYSSIEAFFSTRKENRSTSRGIMTVFFRQADACVVTRQLFNLAAEMNPQIGRELVPIARIGKLSNGIISVDRRLPDNLREKIKQSFLAVTESPEGKQLLMLFQISKMIPFRPEYLTATEALFTEHQQLKTRFARR
jgi:ABC-type phosphate/phosphonate transport system substrate-binding protein